MTRTSFLLAMSVLPFFGLASTVNAQTESGSALGTETAVVSECPEVPYTVGDQVKSLEVSARFSASILSELAKDPKLRVYGGSRTVKKAYAGMRQQAMSSVLRVYHCRIAEELKKRNPDDLEAQLWTLDQATVALQLQMVVMANLSEDSTADKATLSANIMDMTERPGGWTPIDQSVVKGALADVTGAMFTDEVTRQTWLGLQFPGLVNIQGCRTVVRAAISDGSSSLQVSLADVKPALTAYLDFNRAPSVGVAQIASALASAPEISTRISNNALTSCEADIREANYSLDNITDQIDVGSVVEEPVDEAVAVDGPNVATEGEASPTSGDEES